MKKMQCISIDYHSKEPFFEIQCSIKGILSTQTGNFCFASLNDLLWKLSIYSPERVTLHLTTLCQNSTFLAKICRAKRR